MTSKSGLLFAVGLVQCSVLACSGEPGDGQRLADSDAASQVRAFEPVEWDTVFSVGGALNDTLLLMPRLLAASGDRLYAYDYIDHQIKAFDGAGRLRWRFGGEGSGPGEFATAMDLEVAADGRIWITDDRNGRITVLTPGGALDTIIVHEGALIRDVLPTRDALLALPVVPDDAFWIELDRSGRIVGEGAFPYDSLRQVHPIVRPPYATLSADGVTWAVLFPFGSPFFIYEGKTMRCGGSLVGGFEFPEGPEEIDYDNLDNSVSAVAAVLSDSNLYVLPRGRTDAALRSLDIYSLDCLYQRSIRLPRKVLALAYSDGTFFVSYEDPAPTILALTLSQPRSFQN